MKIIELQLGSEFYQQAQIKRAQANGAQTIFLNARTTTATWYQQLGFVRVGDEFPSHRTGEPHVQMIYQANNI